jgi:ABC-type amino acid transport substrate-binding protein
MMFSPRQILAALLLAVTVAAVPAAAAAGPALPQMFASGTVKLGYRDGAPPFSFREHDGRVLGYSIDLCTRALALIAKARNAPVPKIVWQPLTASTRLKAVVEGQVDAECGTTTITLARMEQVDFTVPIYVDGGAVLTRAESKIEHMSDLKGRRLAVIGGTTTEVALKEALVVYAAPASLVLVKDGADGMAALAAGKVDGYAGDRVVLATLRLRSGDPARFSFIANDFSFEPYGIVVRRDDPDFRLALNRALVTIYKSGEIDPIFARWFGDLGRPGPLLNSMFYLNSLPE